MKRSSFALAIVWLLCSPLLLAQSKEVEFYLYNSNTVRLLESSMFYQIHPMYDTSLNLLGQSAWEDRLNFNQETKKSLIGSIFSYGYGKCLHNLSVDYESYFDSSDLEPFAYINRTASIGYRLHWNPLDSLSISATGKGVIRNEQDRYIESKFLRSSGLLISGDVRYSKEYDHVSGAVATSFERKQLEWEAYQYAKTGVQVNWVDESITWNNSVQYSQREEDIFNLVSASEQTTRSYYINSDNQDRRVMEVNSKLFYYPSEEMEIVLSEDYSEKRTNLKTNLLRNNGEFLNNFSCTTRYRVTPNILLDSQLAHTLSIKDFSIAQNTRHTDTRKLSVTGAWEYSFQDSLLLGFAIDLQKTSFPRINNVWDNDIRNRSLRMGWKHYYKERIRMANWVLLGTREDVYIDSLLSGNNHILKSISLLPEMDILMSDRFLFKQKYQLRTDYTNYLYPDNKQNKLYRQASCEFNLVFDTYPLIAREHDQRWLMLPFRKNVGNAFLVNLGYAYEENQYASKESNWYYIHSKNRKHQASLNVKHDIGDFYYTLTPQVSWGTWDEYSVLIGSSFQFDNTSTIEISVVPYSEDMEDIKWKGSINLNLRF